MMSQPDGAGTAEGVSRTQSSPARSIFAVPTPIKKLFDKFPLHSYPTNGLPYRALHDRDAHTLYVFATAEGASRGAPSYNPACLKWQAYLKFSKLPFQVVAANNHASPSGALPFVVPSSSDPDKQTQPVPSGRLQRWAMNTSKHAIEEPGDPRYEAYLSLLDHRVRRAWLYSIYLSVNFTTIAEPLYLLPASSNSFVRLTIARELRLAAEKELLKFSSVINAETLYNQAEEAFAALDTLLAKDDWFFGTSGPGLFDASVFAYTHLLLDDELAKGWADTRLRDALRSRPGLIMHRDRILAEYFPDSS